MESGSSGGGCFKGIGCLLMVIGLAAVCVCGGFVTILFTVVFGMIKGSEPYQHALAEAQAHPEVQQVLGEPITPGWFTQGNINLDNDGGEADLAIPLSGSRSSGTLYVEASRERGEWSYRLMEVRTAEGQRIDLLDEVVVPIDDELEVEPDPEAPDDAEADLET